MIRKALRTVIALACAASMLSVTALGYITDRNWNFEDPDTTITSTQNAQTETDQNGNTYQYLYRGNSTDPASYVLYSSASELLGQRFIISIDFMVPSVGGISKGRIATTTWNEGKGDLVSFWLNEGKIRWGNVNGTVVFSDVTIENDKWYNLTWTIDARDLDEGELADASQPHSYAGNKDGEKPAFHAWLGESTYSGTAVNGYKDKPGDVIIDSIKNRVMFGGLQGNSDYIGKLCYDNYKIIITDDEHYDMDIAMVRALGNVNSVEEGYTAGKYLPGAKAEFFVVYNELLSQIENATLSAPEQQDILDALNTAKADFDAKKIDPSNQSTDPAYINLGAIPGTLSVDANTARVFTLEGEVGKISGELTTEYPIVWSCDSNSDKVSLTDNILTIQPGFDGEITVIATVTKDDQSTVTASKKIEVVSQRSISIDEVVAENGSITIKGKFSAPVVSAATISITGAGISDTGTLLVNAGDNSFEYTAAVDPAALSQEVAISITQAESQTKNVAAYYYGSDWENAVFTAINAATTANAMETALNLHGYKLTIDKAVMADAALTYASRILTGVPYANYAAIDKAVIEANLMVAFANVTRASVENLISSNNALLLGNGFDCTQIATLINGLDNTFYVNASSLTIDGATETVASLAGKLNTILTTLKGTENGSGGTSTSGGTVTSTAGSGSGGGGGGGSTGSLGTSGVVLVGGTTSGAITEESNTVNVEQFADVAEDAWSYNALLFMRQKGIMIGDGKNVRPQDKVTRGEFAKIIVEAFGLKGTDGKSFTDANGEWWASYAQIAAANNIVNGLGDGSFGGNDVINREQLAVMVDRAVKAKGYELYDNNDGVTFDDESYISDYAKESISRLAKKGVVSGIGYGLFAPSLNVTREEAAQIVYNVLRQF